MSYLLCDGTCEEARIHSNRIFCIDFWIRANMEYKSTYQLHQFKYSPDYRGKEMSTKLIFLSTNLQLNWNNLLNVQFIWSRGPHVLKLYDQTQTWPIK